MSKPIIEINGISKKYELGERFSYGNLREEFVDNIKGIFSGKKEKKEENILWALNDVSFDVNEGEVVGIIGRNGAGKSTLLKILSRITEPTKGEINLRGRVASLLEVGTGFHPELTGRENVFFNGALLGMTKREIKSKFDEIVAFSEVEKFIDTPVKRYSSGMYVRLAFAVAAHLEPEILIVDEVLAVGDASFQKKCLGKMGDVAKSGRTVLFVSHNMAAVEKLCSKAVLLIKGNVSFIGETGDAVKKYLLDDNGEDVNCYKINKKILEEANNDDYEITDVKCLNENDENLKHIATGEKIKVRIYYKAKKSFSNPSFSVQIKNHYGTEIIRLNTSPISGYIIEELFEKGFVDLVIDSMPLTSGKYFMDIGIAKEKVEWVIKVQELVELFVDFKDVYGSGMALDNSKGMIVVKHKWDHNKC